MPACFPYPVESIRFSRTKIAPTRRFMQFERRDAREANVCDNTSGRLVENRQTFSLEANHKICVPTRPQVLRVQQVYVIQVRM